MNTLSDLLNYDWEVLPTVVKKGKNQEIYDNNIYSLDTETTSLFEINGKWQVFNEEEFIKDIEDDIRNARMNDVKPTNKTRYSDCRKMGFAISWQIGINDKVFIMRTLDEAKAALEHIRQHNSGLITIFYVHHLGYDFEFVRNIISDLEVFARDIHKPIYATSATYNFQFRCSLFLTNTTLEQAAKDWKLPVEKQVGKWDYLKLRTPLTPLSDDEIKYAEFDCLVLYHLIKTISADYEGIIPKIPMTQTGRVREVVKKLLFSDKSYIYNVCKMQPKSVEEYDVLARCYQGGYTHANMRWVNNIVMEENGNTTVKCYDIASSYPTAIVSEYYPNSSFVKLEKVPAKIDKRYAWMLKVEIENYEASTSLSPISVSKASGYTYESLVVDNGRIRKCDYLTIWVTELDYATILESTSKESKIRVIEAWRATKALLPEKLVSYVLELYGNKTTLKGVVGEESNYTRSKQYVNAVYGMTVTSTVRDDIEFEQSLGWICHELDDELDVKSRRTEDLLAEMRKPYGSFLAYSWGVWVAAYARRNLWKVMLKSPDDVVYCDTDSIKYVGNRLDDFVVEYNKEIIEKLDNACKRQGINPELTRPPKQNGKKAQLGIYTNEPDCELFITFGAKKYACVHDGKLEVTVSGLSKKVVDNDEILKSEGIFGFREGRIFYPSASGRKVLYYQENQPLEKVIDADGIEWTNDQKYGIVMQPTSYRLSAYVFDKCEKPHSISPLEREQFSDLL